MERQALNRNSPYRLFKGPGDIRPRAAFQVAVKLALVVLPLVPVFALAVLICAHAVNVPFWDEWDLVVTMYMKSADGSLSIQDLFAQHNESRKVFPRLLFVLLSHVPLLDHRLMLVLGFGLACVFSGCVYRLARVTLDPKPPTIAALMLLTNLIIFHPNQQELWLWGTGFIAHIPNVCLAAGLVLAYSRLSGGSRTVGCILLNVLSTFSFANGMIGWFLLGIALYATTWKGHPRSGVWGTIYTACMALSLGLYFWDYSRPPYHPALSEAISNPRGAVEYVLAFLGHPLAYGFTAQLQAAMCVGGVLLVMAAVVLLCLASRSASREQRILALPWVLLGMYTVVSAVVTMAGRVGFGIEQALSARYVMFGIYLPIALLFLLLLLAVGTGEGSLKSMVRVIFVVFCGTIFVLLLHAYRPGVMNMEDKGKSRLRSRIALALMDVLPVQTEKDLKLISRTPEILHERAHFLSTGGYLDIPILKGSDFGPEGKTHDTGNFSVGKVDSVETPSRGLLTLEGWARLPDRGSPPDALVFSYQNRDGTEQPFDYTTKPFETPTMEESTGHARRSEAPRGAAPWKYALPMTMLPSSATAIGVWAYDAGTGRLYRLGPTISVSTSEGKN